VPVRQRQLPFLLGRSKWLGWRKGTVFEVVFEIDLLHDDDERKQAVVVEEDNTRDFHVSRMCFIIILQ
jgi:hypothetical protein